MSRYLSPDNFLPEKFNPELFLDNEATTRYFAIIARALLEGRSKTKPSIAGHIYYEKHHIVPQCLGGNNSKTNSVLLTAEEHFIAHQLLTDMVVGGARSKMWNALWRFRNGNEEQKTIIKDAEAYAVLKEEYSKIVSERFKGKPLPEKTKRKMRGSKTISDAHKQIISETHSGKIPWNKGLVGIFSEGTLKAFSEKQKGENNSFYGKQHSFETREQMSESRKQHVQKLWASEIYKIVFPDDSFKIYDGRIAILEALDCNYRTLKRWIKNGLGRRRQFQNLQIVRLA